MCGKGKKGETRALSDIKQPEIESYDIYDVFVQREKKNMKTNGEAEKLLEALPRDFPILTPQSGKMGPICCLSRQGLLDRALDHLVGQKGEPGRASCFPAFLREVGSGA